MLNSTRSVTAPAGFRAAGAAVGVKASGNPDLALIVADGPCKAAAMFTQNVICSEPVQVGREHMKGGSIRAIVCNSGNANASMGKQGLDDARAMCAAVAELVGCKPTQVLACSTGKIGTPLPMDKIAAGITLVHGQLGASSKEDADAARAIMTTDLVPKSAVREIEYSGGKVTLGAICKGSGMIAPDMATMLAFITTDADITLPLLRSALADAVNADASFNRMSVDTDTSPSDTVAILASGAAEGVEPIRKKGKRYEQFAEALTDLCKDLAYQIISDGEGVTRVIRVKVTGAKNEADAVKVGRAVADSPLVKCAVHGGDPNWGRITAAIGRSGAKFEPKKVTVAIGEFPVYAKGGPLEVDLGSVERAMQEREVVIAIGLKAGSAGTEILGCDLSREYITINADYHT